MRKTTKVVLGSGLLAAGMGATVLAPAAQADPLDHPHPHDQGFLYLMHEATNLPYTWESETEAMYWGASACEQMDAYGSREGRKRAIEQIVHNGYDRDVAVLITGAGVRYYCPRNS